MYDIVFISYDESNANENYDKLKSKFSEHSFIHRVHGVKGIFNAHYEAAKKARTQYFFVVDGDNEILDGFNFMFKASMNETETYVWRSINPVNKLIYGYGGVKLLNRKNILKLADVLDTNLDMTTSLTKGKFVPVHEVASITRFNTTPFNAWKGAFRECVKLTTSTIPNRNIQEDEERLNTWLTVFNENEPFIEYVKKGAEQGLQYGKENKGNLENLKLINDFEKLHEIYISNSY